MTQQEINNLPSLAPWFNTTKKITNVRLSDLERAHETSTNFITRGLYYKVYNKVTLFRSKSKVEVTYIVEDTPENRNLLWGKRNELYPTF